MIEKWTDKKYGWEGTIYEYKDIWILLLLLSKSSIILTSNNGSSLSQPKRSTAQLVFGFLPKRLLAHQGFSQKYSTCPTSFSLHQTKSSIINSIRLPIRTQRALWSRGDKYANWSRPRWKPLKYVASVLPIKCNKVSGVPAQNLLSILSCWIRVVGERSIKRKDDCRHDMRPHWLKLMSSAITGHWRYRYSYYWCQQVISLPDCLELQKLRSCQYAPSIRKQAQAQQTNQSGVSQQIGGAISWQSQLLLNNIQLPFWLFNI